MLASNNFTHNFNEFAFNISLFYIVYCFNCTIQSFHMSENIFDGITQQMLKQCLTFHYFFNGFNILTHHLSLHHWIHSQFYNCPMSRTDIYRQCEERNLLYFLTKIILIAARYVRTQTFKVSLFAFDENLRK